jgi:C4-dicarboxylate transporter
MKYSLFLLVLLSIYIAYYFRKRWLKNKGSGVSQRIVRHASKNNKPPAFLKYALDVICSVFISVSSGFFGLIYFFLSKDWQALFVFITISAIAIIYFRPRIEELEKYMAEDGERNK